MRKLPCCYIALLLFFFSRSSFLYGGSSSNTDRATFAKKVIAVETAVLASPNKRQRTRSQAADPSTSSKATSSSKNSVPPGYKGPPLSSKVPPGYKGPPLTGNGNDSDNAMEDDSGGEASVFPVSSTTSSSHSGKKKNVKHVSQDEINKVAAQAMKAQIRGDDKKHAKLTKKVVAVSRSFSVCVVLNNLHVGFHEKIPSQFRPGRSMHSMLFLLAIVLRPC